MLVLWIVVVIVFQTEVYAGCNDEQIYEFSDLNLRQSNRSWDSSVSSTPLVNDAELDSGWYRAVQDGWQYIMTDSRTELRYTNCNTYWPIYLLGIHQAVKNITETAVGAIACITDEIDPCSTGYSIEIRKCNDEIQYKLKRTSHFAGYCFDKYSEIPGQEPPPPNVNLGTIHVSPKLLFEQTNNESLPYTIFECLFFTNGTSYFYTVKWYIGTTEIAEKGPSQLLSDLVLHENDILKKNYTLGIEIQCAVSVSKTMTGLKTVSVYSSKFFAGVKIINTPVYMQKNSKTTIDFKLTVPLGCRYPFSWKFVCVEEVRMFDPNRLTCAPGSIATPSKSLPENQRCATTLTSLDRDSVWNKDKTYKFEIVTTDHTYNDHSVFNMKLQFGEAKHKIWRNLLFPDVKVIVADSAAYKQKICYSHIDPHMRTSDGYYYEMQKDGYYMLYHNKKYHIEVQMITTICWNSPRCTCAVAVRAGKDVFMINICGSINFFGFTDCGDGGILQVVKHNDYRYDVLTPIGTKVTIVLTSGYINVDITMAAKDLDNVEGLCGKFDNNVTNDFLHRDGSSSTLQMYPYTFSDSWRLNDEENLFKTKRNLNAWIDDNALYCICDPNGPKEAIAFCSPSQYLDCIDPRAITKKQCQVTRNRRRRSLNNDLDKELERLKDLMQPINRREIVKRQARLQYHEEEEEARKLCTDKINGSLAVTEYSEVGGKEDPAAVIEQCIYDVTVGQDATLADTHVMSINTIVQNMLDKEPVYVANNTEKIEVFLENTCPGNCSGKGVCTKIGECNCTEFLHGPDCSIDERDPLTIDDIEGGGLCDVANGDDCLCFIVRSNNILDGFNCNINAFKISFEGEQTFVSTNSSKGDYNDIFTGRCCIPSSILGLPNVFLAQYKVSISNNGETFGNEASVYAYDSTCQKITNETTREFTLKDNHCFVDGYCFADGEMARAGCLACKSSLNNLAWTGHNPCANGGSCNDENTGYSCSCQPGFTGINCLDDIDECASEPCRNGGVCANLVNGYNCSCPRGYNGASCEIDIDECSSNPCHNNATCTNKVDAYSCTCPSGFEGDTCDTNIDDCASVVCVNIHHVCVDLINNYTCQCRDGFEGINCTIDTDECAIGPCLNGGSCTDNVNGYTCSCPKGYTGQNCGIETDECSSDPCQNGGNCTDNLNGYTCVCQNGYTGPDCGIDKDECASRPCLNGGSCRDNVNSFTCSCPMGFTGLDCAEETDECSSDPCQNGGSCTDNLNRYICVCQNGYTGPDCGIDIDECASRPCLNGGSCRDNVNGFTCSCPMGFTGFDCAEDIEECASGPCLNGGSCKDNVNGYTCSCQEGYTGHDCDIDTDECVSDPCQNGGSCTDNVDGFTCVCLNGYTGYDCGTDTDECAPSPCTNGGICIDTVNGYTCECPEGYEGRDCEQEVSSTIPSPVSGTKVSNLITFVFPIVTVANLNDDNVKRDIQLVLTQFYIRKLGKAFINLTLVSLRRGSVKADIIAEISDTVTAGNALIKASLELVAGVENIYLMNQTTFASSMQVGDIRVTQDTLKDTDNLCDMHFSLLGECPNSYTCTVQDNKPLCVQSTSENGGVIFLIAITVGVFVAVLVAVGITLILIRAYRLSKKSQKSEILDKNSQISDDVIPNKPCENIRGNGKNMNVSSDRCDGNLTMNYQSRRPLDNNLRGNDFCRREYW